MSTWGDVLKSITPTILGFVGGAVVSNQERQKAKGEANDAKAVADLQYQTALAQERALALQNQVKTNQPAPKSNTALYIGLGVGAVVLIGVVIFAFRRK